MARHAAPKKWYEKVAASNEARGLKEGYRSGLEVSISRFLESRGVPVLYETFAIPYVVPQTLKRYTPDWLLPNGIIVESKGIWDATDRAKHLLVRLQYPDLDVRIVFSRAKTPINPGSKTTCAEWAERHGIQWAEKMVPEGWLSEPGPAIHPVDVLKTGPKGHTDFYNATVKGRLK